MAYRCGDRFQTNLFPPSIEELVPSDSPVRAYDAFIEALDISELGIDIDPDRVGNSSYDPRSMLKLLVYGYSYGVRSSRKLEREVHYNISFIWLMGDLKPDHKTIAEFRRRNKTALQQVLKSCARMCIRLDLIAGNTLFVDGSKFRANASLKSSRSKKQCEEDLQAIDRRIEEIISECETADESEAGLPSYVKMKDELRDKEALRNRISTILKELDETGARSVNTVDRECTRVHSLKGTQAGYNSQIVVDEKNGLIVSSDAVAENNDINQFSAQIEQAHETLGKKCETACADSGYERPEELQKVADKDIKVIVPSQRQGARRKAQRFDKENFHYDKQKDRYICPMGNVLKYHRYHKPRKAKVYKITKVSLCLECPNYGVCTDSKFGRTVRRFQNEELREKFEAEYLKPVSRAVYERRKWKVEPPFGHMKQNLKADHFLVRGAEGARAEMALLSTCFNLRRMITLLGGVERMIGILRNGIATATT